MTLEECDKALKLGCYLTILRAEAEHYESVQELQIGYSLTLDGSNLRKSRVMGALRRELRAYYAEEISDTLARLRQLGVTMETST